MGRHLLAGERLDAQDAGPAEVTGERGGLPVQSVAPRATQDPIEVDAVLGPTEAAEPAQRTEQKVGVNCGARVALPARAVVDREHREGAGRRPAQQYRGDGPPTFQYRVRSTPPVTGP